MEPTFGTKLFTALIAFLCTLAFVYGVRKQNEHIDELINPTHKPARPVQCWLDFRPSSRCNDNNETTNLIDIIH